MSKMEVVLMFIVDNWFEVVTIFDSLTKWTTCHRESKLKKWSNSIVNQSISCLSRYRWYNKSLSPQK